MINYGDENEQERAVHRSDQYSWYSVGVECSERDKIKAEATRALKDIVEFTDRLLKAMNTEKPASLTPLDKDLENAVGAKERAFGALMQHQKEHGC